MSASKRPSSAAQTAPDAAPAPAETRPLPPGLAVELLEQSLSVVPTLDLRDIGARLLAPLVHATDARRASLMIVNPETGRLRVVAGLGIRPEIIGRDTEWRPNSISEWVFRKRQGLVLNGEVRGEALHGTAEEAIESAMCVPLELADGAMGVLNLARTSPAPVFAEADMHAIRAMLPPLAAALQRACRVQRSDVVAKQLEAASGLQHLAMLKCGLTEARHYQFGLARVSSPFEGGAVCERVAFANGGSSVLALDTSGDGVDAMLAATYVLGLFVGGAAPERPAAGTIARLNAELHSRYGGATTAAAWTVQLSPSGQLVSCNAGYPAPLWVPSDDSAVVRLATGGPAVGTHAQGRWDEEQVRLLPGDLVVAASNGVLDARNVTGQPFGAERLAERVGELRRSSLDELTADLMRELEQWTGRPQPTDDAVILALRYYPGD